VLIISYRIDAKFRRKAVRGSSIAQSSDKSARSLAVFMALARHSPYHALRNPLHVCIHEISDRVEANEFREMGLINTQVEARIKHQARIRLKRGRVGDSGHATARRALAATSTAL
jgi:hypothetical protein